jgi:hypothetical protein
MSITAKTLIKDKFWIVEQNGQKLGTLQKKDNNGWIYLNKIEKETQVYPTAESLIKKFGVDIFAKSNNVKSDAIKETDNFDVHNYPCSQHPYNPMFDVQKQLPVYTKTPKSKSQFCAGFYIICFEKGWRKAYCPKMITLSRYEYKGPMKTKLEMQQVLNNAVKEFQDTNKTN